MPEASGSRSSSSIEATEHPPSPRCWPAWRVLTEHASRVSGKPLAGLFDHAPERFDSLQLEVNGLLADFSRQAIDLPVLMALQQLAEQSGLPSAVHNLHTGAPLNFTENRAALHMALRGGCAVPEADRSAVEETEARLRCFAERVRNRAYLGSTGKPITLVIHLGIGGSDLGPRLVHAALAPNSAVSTTQLRFVANIDPSDLDAALVGADAETTLFIISSKSFTTVETLANAAAAKAWLHAALGGEADLARHFAAISNAVDAARRFGIAPEQVFRLPEWVGGRFSVWSAIRLPLLIALGATVVEQLSAGACAMDLHFQHAPLAANLPVRMALVGLWNIDFLGIDTLVMLPYAHALRHFPAWLQQLEMESNGKHCLRDGSRTRVHTAPLILGSTGSIGQHAFHQLFYQGTRRVALDFVAIAPDAEPRRQTLFENALAQAEALMHGRDLAAARMSLAARGLPEAEIADLAPHLVCTGNQPSTTLLLPCLDAFQLGQLLALYEHKVFVQGWIWGINSFDQYGVELGKEMAQRLTLPGAAYGDAATRQLLTIAHAMSRR